MGFQFANFEISKINFVIEFEIAARTRGLSEFSLILENGRGC